jgi:transitional endoplasmic reticulum ATPase
METDNLHKRALELWQEHTSAQRLETDFATQNLLGKAYPAHHVVRTSPKLSDLLAFAKAGHAAAQTLLEGGQDAARVYRAPKSRVEGEAGKVEDATAFGRWDYVWEGARFIVYEMAYIDRFATAQRVLYVLHPSIDPPRPGQPTAAMLIDQLLLRSGQWSAEAHQQIWVFDNARWAKDKALWESVQETSWEDVIVSPAVRQRLNHDVYRFFGNRELYRKSKVPWKRGVIFHGVPGVGKTLFIKTIIKSLTERSPPVPTLYVKSLDACAGPKWSVQQIFVKARRAAPCLLVLEDLDSLVESSTRSYFLNEVDGLSSNDGILMIGSTNNLDQLDPSVTKRPSRFDRKYHFSIPNEDERLAYCQYWRRKFIDSDEVDFPEDICHAIAKLTEKFTFAYLKELFVSSLLLLVGSGKDEFGGSASEMASAGEASTPRSTLPSFPVSQNVQDNLLFKTIESQAHALLADLDSGATSAVKHQDAARPPPPRFSIPSLIDEPDE